MKVRNKSKITVELTVNEAARLEFFLGQLSLYNIMSAIQINRTEAESVQKVTGELYDRLREVGEKNG